MRPVAWRDFFAFTVYTTRNLVGWFSVKSLKSCQQI